MAFEGEYTFVTWDYRGLFSSDQPKRERRLSVRDHAEDALAVLRSFGFDGCDVVVGHSMGVQVALEFSLLFPESCGSLVLLNGSHGHVLRTALQPLFRVPLLWNVLQEGLEFLKAHHTILSFVRAFNNPVVRVWLRVYTHFMQVRQWRSSHLSVYLYLCLSIFMSIYLSIYLIYLPIHLPIYRSISY